MQKQFIVTLSLLVFLAACNSVAGQIVGFGKCPKNVKTVQDFDAGKYVGIWYEYSKYLNIFEAGSRCNKAVYAPINANTISVFNSEINKYGQIETVAGSARIVGPGKLSVRFEGLAAFSGDSDYWVIGTDYTNYSVVYSCKEIGFTKLEFAWLLTRDEKPSDEAVQHALSACMSQKLSVDAFHKTEHKDCSN